MGWLFALALAHAGRGLTWLEPPHADGGRIHARVRVDDPGLLADPGLALAVDGVGLVTDVRPAARDGVSTLLSFDGSGSFRPHHARAFALADAIVARRAPGESVGALVFGRTAQSWPLSDDPAVIQRALADARAVGAAQPETRLAAFVREAIDRVADARPGSAGGIRRVVVFTDAGEESEVFPVEEIAEHARTRRVIVDAVVFSRAGAGSRAEDLDRVARLVALAGGTVVEVSGATLPDARIDALAGHWRGQFDVSAAWCGSAPPSVGVTGAGGAFDDARPATGVVRPCGSPALAPASAVPQVSGEPPDPMPAAPLALRPPGDGPIDRLLGLVCLLAALLAFAGLALLGAWITRRSAARPAPASAAPPAPPAPPALQPPAPDDRPEPPPPPTTSQPFSMHLPERHLEVVGGDLAPGRRWRFSGRILRVGADREENDIVVDLPQVSGTHARFELFPSGAVFVEDLGSANGTWVGAQRLRPHVRAEVPAGERVYLSTQLVLAVVDPGAGR